MNCPKCDGEMTEGFVLDESYGAVKQNKWVAGPAETVKMAPHRDQVRIDGEPINITTFRGGSCGYLESYAK